jgi:ParB family transcriptional regulator, chromosome partitioning protein
LIDAVHKGRVPVSVAVEIARHTDANTKNTLTDAYESGSLTGSQLRTAKRLIEKRSLRSASRKGMWRANRAKLTTEVMVKFFKDEADRQKHLVMKSELARDRLDFLVGGLRILFADGEFLGALRKEGINKIPGPLAKLLNLTPGET